MPKILYETEWELWNTPENLTIIGGMARDGFTDKEIWTFIGISKGTFHKWKTEHPEFRDAIQKNDKVAVDRSVEAALLKRCLGYNYVEVTETERDGKITGRNITHKHIAPDINACLTWLNNRKPEVWAKNKASLNDTDDNCVQINIVKAKDRKPKEKDSAEVVEVEE